MSPSRALTMILEKLSTDAAALEIIKAQLKILRHKSPVQVGNSCLLD